MYPLWKAEVPSTAIVKGFASLNKNTHAWHSFLVLNAELGLVARCKRVVRRFQEIPHNRLISLIITVGISIAQTNTISGPIQ